MSNSAAEQAPEKSSFTRKCSLLSQYLKEKGSFGDINLGLARKTESNLGFAGKPEPRGLENGKMKAESSEVKTFDFIQKLSAAGGPSTSSGGTAMDADLSEPAIAPEPRNSQLTIFFNGKVIVYDEFPVGKAREIMEMAKQANPIVSHGAAVAGPPKPAAEDNIKNINTTTTTTTTNSNNNDCSNGNGKSNGSGGGGGGGDGDAVIPDLNEPSSSEKNNDGHQTRQHQLVERIARRASLHRFIAKRKERAAVRAPYQVNQNAGLPPKPEEASPRLEQGQSSRQGKNDKNDTADVPRSEGHTDKLPEEKGEDVCMKDLELRL